MRLMQAVRSSFRPSRSRCTHSMLCCSMLLTGMKCICGRDAASQTAAASLASCKGTAGEHAPGGIDRMHLDHALGQVNPYANGLASCNLLHGLPLSMASD